MKDEFIKRYKVELKLSPRQLEQMSALHLASWFMDITSNSLKDLPNINPEWIEQRRWKTFDIWYLDKLKEFGFYDTGRLKVRKAKKGYVAEMKFKWTSKGIKKTKYVCKKCQKSDKLDWGLVCEKCAKELKKKRQYSKFIYGRLK